MSDIKQIGVHAAHDVQTTSLVESGRPVTELTVFRV
jgi:hypothetical protein